MMQKIAKNLQLLDNLACNSAIKPSFQNPTKSLFAQYSNAQYTIFQNLKPLFFLSFISSNMPYFQNPECGWFFGRITGQFVLLLLFFDILESFI